MTVIVVALTILFFLALDWLVHGRREREEMTATSANRAEAPAPMRLPDGVFFAPSHTWLNLFPTGRVTLGVDDFVSRLIDHPRVSLLKGAGESVRKGEPILRLVSNGHMLTVRSPIDAEVLAQNAGLVRTPELLRESLFKDGWAYLLKPRSLGDVKALHLGEESRGWLRDELSRLRDFFVTELPTPQPAMLLMQDGGAPTPAVMEGMDDALWHRFEEEFLDVT